MKHTVWYDPRSKIAVMIICILTTSMAPSINYEMGLIALIAVYAITCGMPSIAIIQSAMYGLVCVFTSLVNCYASGSTQVVLYQFFGLIHKIYPCEMIGVLFISSIKINEFLTAMEKLHIPKTVTIPTAVMLRYMPTIREDWHFIKDAMRLRDVSLSIKGLLTHPAMTIECVYVPLMMAASKASDELSIASVTRGIETKKQRTCIKEIKFGLADYISIICFVIYFVIGRFL